VLEGRYDERRLTNVSTAIQEALISVLNIPSDDFIVLEVAFISGRPKEIRLALLEELNTPIVVRAGISPDDLMIQLVEGPGENFSFGQGLAQRAFISQAT
jgi:4-oxalocrotonate tautomerase